MNRLGVAVLSIAVTFVIVPNSFAQNTAPSITSDPSPTTVIVGDDAVFTGAAAGTDPLTYFWQLNGNNLTNGGSISGADTSSLTIAGVAFSDVGDYVMIASNDFGAAASTGAHLTVVSGVISPSITTQPTDRTVDIGYATVFKVVAAGTATITYQWQKDGSSLTNGGIVSGATTANLTLAGVSQTDEGSYTVVVANSGGSLTSAAAALSVNTNIASTVTIESRQSDGTTTLDPPYKELVGSWANSTNKSSVGGLLAPGVRSSTVTAGQIRIKPTLGVAGGNYYVQVTHAAALGTNGLSSNLVMSITTSNCSGLPTNTSAFARWGGNVWLCLGVMTLDTNEQACGITFNYKSGTINASNRMVFDSIRFVQVDTPVVPPSITSSPAATAAAVGDTVILTGAASGDAPLAYSWQVNGTNLVNGGTISGADTSSLTISGAAFSDAGDYVMLASNEAGAAATTGAHLSVVSNIVAASITTQPTDRTVDLGYAALFKVAATGTAPITYQWQKDGVNLTNGGIIVGATSTNLTLAGVSQSDEGGYGCVVTNPGGTTTSSTATLTVNTNLAGTIVIESRQSDGTTTLDPPYKEVVGSWANSTNKSSVSGLLAPGVRSSTVTAGQIRIKPTLGVAGGNYYVQVTHGAALGTNGLSSNLVMSITTSNCSGLPTNTSAFSRWGGNVWLSLGVMTLDTNEQACGITFNYKSGTINASNRMVFDSIRFVQVDTPVVPPSITSSPAATAAAVGDTVTLTGAASGDGPLTYSWQVNGTNLVNGGTISGADTSSLTITGAAFSDAGDYVMLAGNEAGAAATTGAHLSVVSSIVAASITTQPTDRTVDLGYAALFKVRATGTAPITYQWRKGGVNLTNGGIVSGSTSTNLTLAGVMLSDADTYDVVITNPGGTVTSSPAVLTVNTNLAATIVIESRQSDGSVTLDPPYKEVVGSWLNSTNKSTVPGLVAPGVRASTVTAGQIRVRPTLSVTGGTYYVQMTHGGALGTNGLSTNVTMSITQSNCTGLSSNTTIFRRWGANVWLSLGVLTLNEGEQQCALTFNYQSGTINTSNRLVFDAMRLIEASSVVPPPTITSHPTDTTNAAGSTVVFTASADATPPPAIKRPLSHAKLEPAVITYQWQKDGADLTDGANVSGSTTPTLTITGVAGSDEGDYALIATDDTGSAASQSAHLTIANSPGCPTILGPSSLTDGYLATPYLKALTINGVPYGLPPLNSNVISSFILNGNYLSLPISSVGNFLAFGEGARFNAAGTGGETGIDYWFPGTPVYNYAIGVDGSVFVNGGLQGQTVTNLSDGNLLRAVITGYATSSLLFTRDISFGPNDKVIRIKDTIQNVGLTSVSNIVTLDNTDPDQNSDVEGASTVNDVVSVLASNDAVVASAQSSGLSLLFGSSSGFGVPSANGFSNTDPYSQLTVTDPDGAAGDIGINFAQNYGALAPGETKSATLLICFGNSVGEVTNEFAQANAPVTDTYSFALTSGTLPPGLALATNGILSGTPTANGSYSFDVTATPQNGCAASQSYTMQVTDCPTIVISPSVLSNAFGGQNYTQTLSASGGVAPYAFAVTGGSLSNGITLAANGAFSGTPTNLGVVSFIVTATDANGCTVSQEYSLTNDCGTISVLAPQTNNLTIGDGFYQNLDVSGGTPPYTNVLTAGSLPLGIYFDGSVFSGVACEVYTGMVTVNVTDALGCTASQDLYFNVAPIGTALDTTIPTVAIKSPRNKSSNTSGFLTVNGIAHDSGKPKSGVAAVVYSLNGGHLQLAATSDRFTNWQAPLVLSPGWNTFTVFAIDYRGHQSFARSAIYLYGNPANIIGSYNGLFAETNGSGDAVVREQSAGFLNIHAAYSGTQHGHITVAGVKYPFSGTFDLAGNTVTTVSRGPLPSLTLNLVLDWSGTTRQVTGTVSCPAEGWTSEATADLAVFNAKNNPFTAAQYTMVIPPAPDAPTNSPGGYGYASISIKPSGVIKLGGALADSTPISQAVPISIDYRMPFYANLYDHQGLIGGWIDFSSGSPTGNLTWVKPGNVGKLTTYLAGFTNTLTAFGASYTPVTPSISAGVRELDLSDASGLNLPLILNVTLGTDNKIVNALPSTNHVVGTIISATGLMKVNVVPTDVPKAKIKAGGAVLQSHNAAYGSFVGRDDGTGKTNTGSLYLH